MTKADIARQNGKKGGRPRKHPLPAVEPASSPLVSQITQPEKPTETDAPPIAIEYRNPETKETQKETQEPSAPDVVATSSKLEALPPKHRLFVEHYCGDAAFDASLAYELAGFEPSKGNASRLRRSLEVSAAIEERVAAMALKARGAIATDEEILARSTQRARGDIRKLFHADDPIAKLPDEVASTIKAITPTRYGRRIELYDAHRDDELLLKVSGKLTERHDVKVTHTLEDILADANARHFQRQLERQAS